MSEPLCASGDELPTRRFGNYFGEVSRNSGAILSSSENVDKLTLARSFTYATLAAPGEKYMSTDTRPAGAYRIRHLALQVADLERSVAFYCGVLGMQVLRRRSNPIRKDIAAYVGYGPEDREIAIELYQFVDQPALPPGEKPSHFALAVQNIAVVAEDLARAGGTIRIPPQHNRPGSINKFAFVRDPDGHEIELTENT